MNPLTRVRIMYNPRVNTWHVYEFDRPNVIRKRTLELRYAAVYSVVKPRFAPEGTPSFVGYLTELDYAEGLEKLGSHPYAPGVLFWESTGYVPFSHSNRLQVYGPKMWAERPLYEKF